jgi:hypothetical protein
MADDATQKASTPEQGPVIYLNWLAAQRGTDLLPTLEYPVVRMPITGDVPVTLLYQINPYQKQGTGHLLHPFDSQSAQRGVMLSAPNTHPCRGCKTICSFLNVLPLLHRDGLHLIGKLQVRDFVRSSYSSYTVSICQLWVSNKLWLRSRNSFQEPISIALAQPHITVVPALSNNVAVVNR